VILEYILQENMKKSINSSRHQRQQGFVLLQGGTYDLDGAFTCMKSD
jgi:hypothetical protein